ncbi:MAG: hypothetical protein R3C02_01815 [Planctomycetaceae bacterium]
MGDGVEGGQEARPKDTTVQSAMISVSSACWDGRDRLRCADDTGTRTASDDSREHVARCDFPDSRNASSVYTGEHRLRSQPPTSSSTLSRFSHNWRPPTPDMEQRARWSGRC